MWVNFRIMLRRRSFWFAFAAMTAISLWNYFLNVLSYRGQCIDNVPAASTLYYLNHLNRTLDSVGIVYVALFFIMLPYACAHQFDCRENTGISYIIRTKRLYWYMSQAVVAATGAVAVLLIPSLLNILLNQITFVENGNFTGTTGQAQFLADYFESITGTDVFRATLENGAKLRRLIYFHPQLYNVAYAFLFAFVGGVFAYFAYALSLFMGQFKIFAYVIPFVFVLLLDSIGEIWMYNYMPVYICPRIPQYVSAGFANKLGCYYPIFFAFCGTLILVSTGLILVKGKHDER